MTTSTFEITNGCVCYKVDEEGEAILDSYGEPEPSDYCFGCFEDEMDNLKYCVVEPWLKANGIEEGADIRVDGSSMGWTHSSGWTTTVATVKGIVDALSINTEWTLRFRLEEDDTKLIAVRSSHDELGARFEFALADEEGEDA
jgi:hypothetical protein